MTLPWVEPTVAALFHDSLERCLADEGFLPRFYARFIPSHPSIEPKFVRTDMKRQLGILRASLFLVARAAGGHPDGVAHLTAIARTHSRRGYGVESFHYDLWLNALIAVAAETDRRFDAETEKAWRAMLEPCIAAMRRDDVE